MQYLGELSVLASEMNFTRAAERLYISQPALTKHIQILEDELGFPVFFRTQPLSLTSAGKYLLNELSDYSEHVQEIINHAKLIHSGSMGNLIIALPNYSKALYLSDLRAFQRKFPNIDVNIKIEECNSIIKWVLDGSVDMGVIFSIGRLGEKDYQDFNKLMIGEGYLGIVSNAFDDRFREVDCMSIMELNEFNYVIIDDEFYRNQFKRLQNLNKAHNFFIYPKKTVATINEALMEVLLHDYIFVQPGGNNGSNYGPGYKKTALSEKDYTFSRYLIWRKDNTNPCLARYAESTLLRSEKNMWSIQEN